MAARPIVRPVPPVDQLRNLADELRQVGLARRVDRDAVLALADFADVIATRLEAAADGR